MSSPDIFEFDTYTSERNKELFRIDYFGLKMRYVGFAPDHPYTEWVEESRKRIGWICEPQPKEAIELFEKIHIRPMMGRRVYFLDKGGGSEEKDISAKLEGGGK